MDSADLVSSSFAASVWSALTQLHTPAFGDLNRYFSARTQAAFLIIAGTAVTFRLVFVQSVYYADRADGFDVLTEPLRQRFTNSSVWTTFTPEANAVIYPCSTAQAPDFHFYEGYAVDRHQNHLILVRRIPTDTILVHYRIYCIGLSNRPIRDWLTSLLPRPPQAIVHITGGKRGWVQKIIKFREMETVFTGIKYRLLRSLEAHQLSGTRQNWVFAGPPGVGKTMISHAIASELKRPFFVFNIMDVELTDGGFQYWMNVLPPRAIVLFEDVRYPFGPKLSGTTMLNFLDGVLAEIHPGRLLIVTTNTQDLYENLPEELRRPGRLSDIFNFPFATPDDAQAMFMQEYSETLDKSELVQLAKEFGSRMNKEGISHSRIAHYLNSRAAREAIADVHEIIETVLQPTCAADNNSAEVQQI